MSDSLDPSTGDPATGQHFGAPFAPLPEPAPTSARRKRSAGHVIAIVVGCLALVPGFAMTAGGGAIALGQAVATDDDGYFRYTLDRVESSGVAIAAADGWFDDVEVEASPGVLDWIDLDLRVRVGGAGATDDVFVGIGRSDDVERYLSEAAFSEITEVEDNTVTYREIAGTSSIDLPNDQDFWAETASGRGEQELIWNARSGRWSVVVMNTDGSSVVSADVQVGAKSGAVTPFAAFLLVAGGLTLLFGVVMIVVGTRGRKQLEGDSRPMPSRPFPSPPTPPPSAPTPPPSATSLQTASRPATTHPVKSEQTAAVSNEQRHPTPVG